MKQKLLFTLILGLLFFSGKAQIGMSKSKAMKVYSENFKEEGKTDTGIEYIVLEEEYESNVSGQYTQYKAIYFDLELEDEFVCSRWKIIEPVSEINGWIKFFKEKNFVQLESMIYKDYENSTIYDVSIDEESCIIDVYFDNKS